MKMKIYSLAVASLGLTPGLFIASAARAEDAAPVPRLPMLTLNFPGGTVGEYADSLLKAGRGEMNIVVMPDARAFKVPPLQLTTVDLGAALHLLHGVQESRGRRVMELMVQEVPPNDPQGRMIHTISAVGIGPDEGRPTEGGVWTISELIGYGVKAEDALTAIQSAVELGSGQLGPAEIKYHDATGLVIAQGHPQQLNTIDQVVKRLREGAKASLRRSTGDDSNAGTTSTAEWTAALDRLKAQNEDLGRRLAEAERREVEMKAQIDRLQAQLAGKSE